VGLLKESVVVKVNMFNCINNINTIDKNRYKRSNVAFGAKIIPTELGREIEKTFFSVKSIDIHAHNAADHDTGKAAAYMCDKFEARRIKAYLCADENELKDLGIDPKKYRIKKNSKPSEATLMLDHNGWDKVSEFNKKLIEKSKQIWKIDHHPETENTIPGVLSYFDTTAKSCCAILYRLAESVGEKLNKVDAENLYCGIVSDFEKSKRIKIEGSPEGSKIVRLPAMDLDKNSAEVLDKFETILSKEERTKIHNHLDIISNLTPEEQAFRTELFSRVKVTPNGKMAYAVIHPDDNLGKIYKDDTRGSAILRDLRLRLINGIQEDKMFSAAQKESFKNPNGVIDIKGAIVFYPVPKNGKNKKAFQLSVHSKKDTNYAKNWTDYAKKAYSEKEKAKFSIFNLFHKKGVKNELWAGGHDNRSGGRIYSFNKTSDENLIESFLEAGQNVE